MNTVKIIGIKAFKSKASGKMGFTYYFIQDFTDYELENSEVIEGKSCDSEYSGTDYGVKIGDEVELQYTKGFQDKAQLVGMNVVKAAGK